MKTPKLEVIMRKIPKNGTKSREMSSTRAPPQARVIPVTKAPNDEEGHRQKGEPRLSSTSPPSPITAPQYSKCLKGRKRAREKIFKILS